MRRKAAMNQAEDDRFIVSAEGTRAGDKVEEKRRRNVYPVTSFESVCLMVSSCFFLIPGGYGFANNLMFFGFVSFVTTAVSINFWRYAIDGPRRTADLITAKASFVIYFISGCIFVRNTIILIVAIPGCLGIFLFYYLSNLYWNKDSPTWVYFHMLFHLFVAFEQFLVVYGICLAGAQSHFNV
jgi:hypothetical protein